ncbi:fucose isomerase [Rhodothermaceae bacterium RA]|nr:fucose isomerase [Rhodothermaceae bacterium RA]
MPENTVTLIASGDLRLSANRNCWPAQQEVERRVIDAIQAEGYSVERGHPYDADKQHGFIDSQRYGLEVFRKLDPERPLVIACAAWQYSHHVLAGLTTHRGPILTVANWSGTWPGLVGMLNLNGCLTKAGIPYSTLWSEDFTDEAFRRGLRSWLRTGHVHHDDAHVQPARNLTIPDEARRLGERLASTLQRDKAIMGVFDEGCMGMFNAIVPDHLLHPTGVFKERLSQSALYYETTQVPDEEARRAYTWLRERGMQFRYGPDPAQDLTEEQVLLQLKTYIAAVRIADDFGCDLIGIQYQQGLKDLLPASDLAEGLLNNTERPPVLSRDGRRELYAGAPLPHFNEVDECAGLDALVTHRVWNALGFAPETTLHDVRWGDPYEDEYVWVFEISGAAPPAHFIDGYAGTVSERQPPMYFRLGGGTVKGISKPGEIVWSRIYVEDDRLRADVGRARVAALPREETERRWQLTTPQWPIMHAVLYGVTRDQMMARHKSNHIQVAYAPDAAGARRALAAKVAMFQAMGIETFVCGTDHGLT